MYLAGGAGPAVLAATTARSAGRCGSPRSTTRSPTSTGRHRRLPARCRRRRASSTSRSCARRERRCCAGSAAAVRARERAWSFDGGTRLDDGVQRHVGGRRPLPTLAFGNYVDPARRDRRRPSATTTRSSGPSAAGWRMARRCAWRPASAPCRCCSATGTVRGGATSESATTATTTTETGEEQLWRIDAGAPPRLYTAADGWAAVQIWGMGIASYDLTGDGYPEVYLTSQGENRLQTLADGPASRPTATSP